MVYTYDPDNDIKKPHLISQAELDDLVRDLSLSKEKSELLGFRLKEWNLHGVCFCHDVTGLVKEPDKKYVEEEWRLFTDSSSSSLKAALLNNGNQKPSITIAHAVGMKETYETMNTLDAD